jgi:hypothetical protein
MSYIDAGYASALGALFAYSCLLIYRHRRLSQLARSLEHEASSGGSTNRPDLDREEV